MLSLKDVARIFKVPQDTIRRWCEQGKIRCYHAGSPDEIQFRHEDVAVAYLDESIKKCLGH